MKERVIEFEFAGNSFVFRADVPEDEISELLSYLEEKKKMLPKKGLSPLKTAILLLLDVALDVVRLKKQNELLSEKVGREVVRISEAIERELRCLGCA